MSDYGTFVDARTARFERVLPGPIERVWDHLTKRRPCRGVERRHA